MAKLTREEKRLLDSYNRGEWRSVKNVKQEIQRIQSYAKAALRKDQRVNIRLSAIDLQGIRHKAFEEGMPYQTLIASVIHKYVAGTLVPKS